MNGDNERMFLHVPDPEHRRQRTYFIVASIIAFVVACTAAGGFLAYKYVIAPAIEAQNIAGVSSDGGDNSGVAPAPDVDAASAKANSQVPGQPAEYPEFSSMPVKPPRPPPEPDTEPAEEIQREPELDGKIVAEIAENEEAARLRKKAAALAAAAKRDAAVKASASKESVRKESAKSAVVIGTAANFRTEVERTKGVVMVDFWAPWCGPCRQMSPLVDQVGAESKGKIKVVKVNVDDAPTLSSRFQITAIPCLIVFKDGKVVDQRVGAQPKATLSAWVKNFAN